MCNFMELFFLNEDVAKYILHKKLVELLELPNNLLTTYTFSELNKIHSLLKENVTNEDMILILSKCILSKVTIYNINDILTFLNEYNDLMSGKLKVEWGPGNSLISDNDDNSDTDTDNNHTIVALNIKNHYNKHILSEERHHWNTISCNLSREWYTNYPIVNFTTMERIVIHSNGRNTYLSGFVGNVFIVGRYHTEVNNEGPNKKFGISSCYYVVGGNKSGRYVDKCTK